MCVYVNRKREGKMGQQSHLLEVVHGGVGVNCVDVVSGHVSKPLVVVVALEH